jgi:hypothetical protein
MVDLSKKIQDLTGDELRELKDEADRAREASQAIYRKLFQLSMNPGSELKLPRDFRGSDGAVYRWKEAQILIPVVEKVNDAVVE